MGKVLVVGLLLSCLAPPVRAARHLVLDTVDADAGFAVSITHAGDERLFVVDREGLVWIYVDGEKRVQPFLDLRGQVLFEPTSGNERGLLSLAFHPDYAENGYFFVGYTAPPDGDSVISRFSVGAQTPHRADPSSERELLRVPEPAPSHNLDHIAFGPDGMLYATLGDGGYQREPRCTPQQGDVLLGKMIRLDVDTHAASAPFHAVPADNPFVDDPTVRDEIWALGLRNPWRFTFDRLTGDLLLTDVGQNAREELNFLAAGEPGGQNYGWKQMEGSICLGDEGGCDHPLPPCFDPAYTSPVIDYGHDGSHCAVIGGPVYRGSAIDDLQGALLLGDYCGATSLVTRDEQGWHLESLSNTLPQLVTWGEDADGEVYLVAGGVLSKVVGVFDEDAGIDTCLASDTTLCLHDNRFEVTASWLDYQGNTGPGHVRDIDLGDSGLFWFFGPKNMELLVKVLDACSFNGRYWLFAAGTTDVEYHLRVVDTRTGVVREVINTLGTASPATTDTDAFDTCP